MRRHDFDLLSFTAGVAFVGLAVAFLTGGADVVAQARWLWPTLLLTLGAAGLAATLGRRDGSDAGAGD